MKTKKLLSILLTLAMLASLVPFAAAPALAADESTGISYREYSYSGGTLSYADKSLSEDYTVVKDTTPVTWNEGWYVVNDNVEIGSRITVNGSANLILADGYTLTADAGITVTGNNRLTIYGQSAGTGTLIAGPNGTSTYSGIGGAPGALNGGIVTVHGGTVKAYAGAITNAATNPTQTPWNQWGGAGIGGGANSNNNTANGGTFTIYGGTVYAYGNYGGAGIGGGNAGSGGNGGTVNIFGGEVHAYGSGGGAGIGGGSHGGIGGEITISGGEVYAYGGNADTHGTAGAGIGGAGHNSGDTHCGTITINGGTVYAYGALTTNTGYGGGTSTYYAGAGIGNGSDSSSGGSITINGGTVCAYGGITQVSGNISGTANGAANGIGAGSGNNTPSITINGGEQITATGGGSSARGLGTSLSTKDVTYVSGSATSHEAVLKGKFATPEAAFTATGADCGELSGLVANAEYTISGAGLSATDITADSNGEYKIASGLTATPGTPATLSVVRKADTNHEASAAKEITVARATAPVQGDFEATHCTTKLQNDGKITINNPVSGATYAYSVAADASDADWTDFTSGAITTGLVPGTYYIRVQANSYFLASDASPAIVVAAFVATQHPTPNAYFTGTDTNAGTLTNLVDGATYTVTGAGLDNSPFTMPNNTTEHSLSGLTVTAGSTVTLSIVRKGDDTTYDDSAAQTITILAPAAPTVTSAYATGQDVSNGSITVSEPIDGVTYEYKTSSGSSWTDFPATGLAYGDYKVRVKAGANTLQSAETAIKVKYQLPAPTATFEATGADCGTLHGLTPGKYVLSGTAIESETNILATTSDFTLDSLKAGTLSLVYTCDDDVYIVNSDAQNIIITQATQPDLTVTQPTTEGQKGTVAASDIHEYSDDNGTSWMAVTTGGISLPGGEYLFRVKATGTVLASPAQTVHIGVPHLVTVENGTVNGKASDYFVEGDTVTITATVPSGKVFDKWTSDYALDFDATAASTSFHMPAQNVTVTATFKDEPAPYIPSGGVGGGTVTKTYKITVAAAENGSAKASAEKAAEGDKITVTATPADGYELDAVTVKGDKTGNSVEVKDGAFTMPAEDVTVTAKFKEKKAETPTDDGLTIPELLEMFPDLDPNGWYLNDVLYCVDNGYMKGMSSSQFGPNLKVSRAMVAQLLWNLAGNPAGAAPTPFDDVKPGDWFYDAVNWAYANGVTKGTGVGFEPDLDITREQLAVMLYNYAKLQGKGFTGLWSFKLDFPDADTVSDWAVEAVSWMVMNGVIKGTTDETGTLILDPQGDATRVQLAAMVHRFCALIE